MAECFIDIHTHGIGRFDTRTAGPDPILKMAALHGRTGTKAIMPAIYPGPVAQMRMHLEAVRKAMERQVASDNTAVILGAYLEGPFLNPGKCGALDPSSFLRPTLSALDSLMDGFEDVIKVITIAPELSGALRIIERCASLGIRVSMGHSEATFRQASEAKKAGATCVTHIFNAMAPFHHREPGLAGLGLLDEDLYIEVIADGIHLHPRTIELIFNCKRMDRIILVSDSVKSGMKKKGAVYKAGDTLAGSCITLSDSVSLLKGLDLPDAGIIEAASDNPARFLGLSREFIGRVRTGENPEYL